MLKPMKEELRKFHRSARQFQDKRYLKLLARLLHLHQTTIPYASRLLELLKAADYSGFVKLADNLAKQQYASAAEHFAANQFSLLVRKYPWKHTDIGTDPKGAAIAAFWKSERSCARQNRLFKCYNTRSPREEMLQRMRSFIRYVLGDEPNINAIIAQCDFGGGASVGVHGNRTNFGAKLSSEKWSVSPAALNYSINAIGAHSQIRELFLESRGNGIYCLDGDSFRGSFLKKVELVNNNIVGFVNKTVFTHRAIAVEPLLNGYLQKGIDQVMRSLLRKIGIDLSDQSRNQFYARFGSEDWESDFCFCTIDLSSASDSISIELCRNVLPPAWFELLSATRSRYFKIQGSKEIHRYEKFCSMGNGFCFPLETLLFAACVHASGGGVPRKDYIVYGDDIICRRPVFQTVISNLRFLGFRANRSKTFGDGPFRESCGADWYNGEDVRPYTLDHTLGSLRDMFKFLNLTQRNERTKAFFQGVEQLVMSWIPEGLRFWRPFEGPEDTGIDFRHGFCIRGILKHWDWHKSRSDKDPYYHCYSWLEYMTTPVKDVTEYSPQVHYTALLRGSLPDSPDLGTAVFTVRRITRSRVRLVSHGSPGFGLSPLTLH